MDNYGKASEKTRSRYVNQRKLTRCFQCSGESSRITFFHPTRPIFYSKFPFVIFLNFRSVSKSSECKVFSEVYFVLFTFIFQKNVVIAIHSKCVRFIAIHNGESFFLNRIILFLYECVRRKHDIEMCCKLAPTQSTWVPFKAIHVSRISAVTQPKVTQIMRCTTEKICRELTTHNFNVK